MAALETLNNRVVIISGAAQNIGAHMLKKFAEEEAKKIHEANAKHINLVGRYGIPEDIARAVHYFLDEDDFCNGAVINEDGGAIITGSILHA